MKQQLIKQALFLEFLTLIFNHLNTNMMQYLESQAEL
jgi:hypothetical protein